MEVSAALSHTKKGREITRERENKPTKRSHFDAEMTSRDGTSVVKDPEADGWEKTDFPIVCESCLGPNKFVRMQREDYGAECAISGRPFTVFRWRPGHDARYKKTVVCREIALAKNVCQVCLLDLEFGIPVQARDAALGAVADMAVPKSAVNVEYVTKQIEDKLENGEADVQGMLGGVAPGQGEEGGTAGGKSGIVKEAMEQLTRMARKKPYYQRNKAPICTFWLKDACNRADCPFRPCNGDTNMPELSANTSFWKQDIKDRYYGTNDPVAEAMLKRNQERKPVWTPPEDGTIKTFFISGLDADKVTESDLKGAFCVYGNLKRVQILKEKKCAFITFGDRESAEAAAKEKCGSLGFEITGVKLKCMWGKSKGGGKKKAETGGNEKKENLTELEKLENMQMPAPTNTAEKNKYNSMDPNAMGAATKK